MTKNEIQKLVPDVCVQTLIVDFYEVEKHNEKATMTANMLETGLICYCTYGIKKGMRLQIFTSYKFKTFLDKLKPGFRCINSRGKEFLIEGEPHLDNGRMCVRANGDLWFCDTLYNSKTNY